VITFELVTLDGVKFAKECYEVMLPTEDGQISVFPHHAPLVSVAVPGIVAIRKRASDKDDQLDHYAIDGGVIEINGRRVRLLVDEAEHASDIDHMQAQAALRRARELMKQSHDRESAAQATARVERELARIRVAEIKRRSSGR